MKRLLILIALLLSLCLCLTACDDSRDSDIVSDSDSDIETDTESTSDRDKTSDKYDDESDLESDKDLDNDSDLESDKDSSSDSDLDSNTDSDIDSDLDSDTDSDAQMCTVTFDPKGGTFPEGTENFRLVEKNDVLGSNLPKPTKPGYIFGGWFAEYDTEFEDKYGSTSRIVFDVKLVAKWNIDPESQTINVYLDAGEGSLPDGASDTLVITSGTLIGNLPTPTQDGYNFDGWYLESDTLFLNKIDRTTRIDGKVGEAIVLVAKWKKIVYCLDGTENHQWSPWDEYTQATCETPQQDVRECTVCGETEYKYGAAALGHQWSAWSYGLLTESRACSECKKTETVNYKNITQRALGVGNLPVINGAYDESVSPSVLIDSNFDNALASTIAGKGGELRITLNLAMPTYIDAIYVKGIGTAPYEVTYYTKDGEQHYAGMGRMGSTYRFECGAAVTKVVFYMANSANGTDGWQEIALAIKKD